MMVVSRSARNLIAVYGRAVPCWSVRPVMSADVGHSFHSMAIRQSNHSMVCAINIAPYAQINYYNAHGSMYKCIAELRGHHTQRLTGRPTADNLASWPDWRVSLHLVCLIM
jgi:hypothetical protein